jgi:hypothetical protein
MQGLIMAEFMMVAGAVAAVTGAVVSGESQAQTAHYNAQIANNEAIQGQNAARFAIEQNTSRTERLLSQQRAQIAKSGFDITGSPLLLMEETARLGSLENQMLQYQADLQSQNMRQNAVIQRKGARNARVSGLANAGSGLLSAGLLYNGLNKGTSTTV